MDSTAPMPWTSSPQASFPLLSKRMRSRSANFGARLAVIFICIFTRVFLVSVKV